MNFNSVIKDCVKNMEFEAKNQGRYFYSSNDHYNSTLVEQVGSYSIPIAERKKINCIIYNSMNSDGVGCSSIVYHYLKSKNKNADIELLRVGAGAGRILKVLNRVKGKTVIFLDLLIESYVYKKFAEVCKKIYSIDDHAPPKGKLPDNVHLLTTNNGHSAISACWNVFYPKKKVPKTVKIIDSQDSKKYMKSLPYGNWFVSALTFRYVRNPRISPDVWASGKPLDDIWKIIDGNESNFYIVLGKYMDDVLENIKTQVARNSVLTTFLGYPVAALNFLDPIITKRVGREMNSMYEGKVKFAVLFGYELAKHRYKVTLIDSHKDTNKINLGRLAEVIGKMCGNPESGGGHFHIGNAYLGDKCDIWDLFKKDLLTEKDKKYIMGK